ncbi:3-hydroxyacyl-ACP dehydratase [Arcobacter sp.]|uniref:3-hydroxyacyl-ACP dehydratase n=1 Tax=Arcobacter sp. TaxID=1872629 RepID=UPI003D0B1EBF
MKLLKNLFEVIEKSENYCKVKLARKEHPVFKAHFPKNEILPGFMQIDIIAHILNHKVMAISKVKFLSIIKPEDIIEYHVTSIKESRYKILIKNGNQKVSEIIYEC